MTRTIAVLLSYTWLDIRCWESTTPCVLEWQSSTELSSVTRLDNRIRTLLSICVGNLQRSDSHKLCCWKARRKRSITRRAEDTFISLLVVYLTNADSNYKYAWRCTILSLPDISVTKTWLCCTIAHVAELIKETAWREETIQGVIFSKPLRFLEQRRKLRPTWLTFEGSRFLDEAQKTD